MDPHVSLTAHPVSLVSSYASDKSLGLPGWTLDYIRLNYDRFGSNYSELQTDGYIFCS
jgi:hypothetical protein